MKKRITALILCLVILTGIFTAGAAETQKKSLTFAVATDMHIIEPKDTLEVSYPESDLYFHASGSGNLYAEAAALTRQMCEGAIENNVDFVLIPGDLTRNGTKEQHEYVAGILREYTQRGLKIYVVPGNHDLFKSTAAEFKTYYADFGYTDALVKDDKTASYTADVADGYRLIAVDSQDPGENGDGLDDRLFNWIDEQVSAANKDGRKIIYMEHHSVLEHLALGHLLMKDFIVRDYEDVAERFCNWGIQYIYTGHEHGNDIARYVGKNGNVLYDVLTTSLSSYPLEYRMVTYNEDGVQIRMNRIEKCDFTRLVNGYNDAQLELMENDYTEYSYGAFRYAIEKKILKYVSPSFLKGKLKVEDGLIADELDALLGLVVNTLDMPLYDSGDGSLSIEKLAGEKGVKLPETDYTSMVDLATAMVAMHYYGDENMPVETAPESELLIKSLNTGLQYILSEAGEKSVRALFGLAEGSVSREILSAVDTMITSITGGRENSYKTARAVLNPLIEEFAVDAEPGDRDVDLPALGETAPVKTFIERLSDKIMSFINYILSVIFARFDIKIG